ncbi:RNA-binding protein [Candidatus Woesearchaeota archaeon]|nr:RNA-binding protein [Candidatus Woesearchaeota archaeon]
MPKKKEETKAEEKIPEQAIAQEKCMSCNTSVVNDIGTVRFPCPNCAKHTIIRCSKCRKTVAKYKCPECGFEGPN